MRKRTLTAAMLGMMLTACQTTDPTDSGSTAWSFITISEADSILRTSDNFQVDSAKVQDDSLILFASYTGGCKEHAFTPYCSNYILKSNPPQIDLWFHHEANGDDCKALIHERLTFDLKPAVEMLQGKGTLWIQPHPEDALLNLQYP